MPAAAAIPWITAAVSTAATVYSAKKGADAAKQAAQAQTAAGDQSLALQREMWQTGRQDLQPWVTQGTNAVNTMGTLMGLGGGGGAAPPAATPVYGVGTRSLAPADAQGRILRVKDAFDPTYDARMADFREDRRADRRTERLGEAMTPAQEQTQSGYVQMRAPDGSVQPIAPQFVDHYRQRGATVVG